MKLSLCCSTYSNDARDGGRQWVPGNTRDLCPLLLRAAADNIAIYTEEFDTVISCSTTSTRQHGSPSSIHTLRFHPQQLRRCGYMQTKESGIHKIYGGWKRDFEDRNTTFIGVCGSKYKKYFKSYEKEN